MKTIIKGTLLLSTLLLGSQVYANELDTINTTNWSLGVGSYAFSLNNTNDSSGDLDFSGFNISAGYAVNNNFQIRGTYFNLENDDYSTVKSKGFDLMAYGGTGFSRKGFRGYGGAGLFSDKWSAPGESESFSGIQLGGGLGYNWGSIAIDLVVNLRQADKYEDFMSRSGTYIAAAGNLSLSYLF